MCRGKEGQPSLPNTYPGAPKYPPRPSQREGERIEKASPAPHKKWSGQAKGWREPRNLYQIAFQSQPFHRAISAILHGDFSHIA